MIVAKSHYLDLVKPLAPHPEESEMREITEVQWATDPRTGERYVARERTVIVGPAGERYYPNSGRRNYHSGADLRHDYHRDGI